MEALLNKLLHRINEEKLNRMLRSVKVDELEQVGILQYRYCLVLSFTRCGRKNRECGFPQLFRIGWLVGSVALLSSGLFMSRYSCSDRMEKQANESQTKGARRGLFWRLWKGHLMRAAVSRVFKEPGSVQKAVTQVEFLKRLCCPEMITNSPWENSDCTRTSAEESKGMN
ncbi:MAG: hypothetical protein ACLTQG_30675 [Hungatella sp.]|uniref:hypothetical protein n=1 Tax=Hungatella sp. TaxID=2613924 RepID=UPI003993E14B